MLSPLNQYISNLSKDLSSINEERKLLLNEIAENIQSRLAEDKPVNLVFICTHNSRRSHLGMIWAATMAGYFGIEGIKTYSGGTEVTAFNVRAVNALMRAGFDVKNPGGSNPKYEVRFDTQSAPLICFSKVYDDPANPKVDFIALMTCTSADEGCPVVHGADARYQLFYKDPKEADDTPWEGERYEERVAQIGAEMYFLMEKVKSTLNG